MRPAAASPSSIPLSQLLAEPRRLDAPVAFERGALLDRDAFEAQVAARAGGIAAAGGGRWLVTGESSLDAAVSLLALARAGAVAVLPPNRQPDTLRRLGDDVRGVLAADTAPSGPALGPRPVDRDAPWIELYTSGTSGEPRRHLKCVRHLEDEVATLDALFGSELPPGAAVFASVPHHHIYGLLFRVLWPLASGRPFQSEALLHVQELVSRMARAEACALVATPVHLRHMATADGLLAARGRCRAVFSSAGPLDAETAKAVTERLGVAPFEILGSTETGGVALRQRSVQGESWRPLPGVEVERNAEDGTLWVSSPFVSEGEARPDGRRRFRMGDRIELEPGGGFRLLGRADRFVKIGGLRLSLPAMERSLEEHPFVREAALATIARGPHTRVAAAVVPSQAGREALRADGRRAVGLALARHLAAGFDPVLRPRTWRYLEELPRDARGKLPRSAVEALFAASPRAGRLEKPMRVEADLPCLRGHFEGHPVVPGVAQIGWVLEAARELLGGEPRLRGFEALKFPTPLRPGDTLEMSVELEGEVLRFSLRDGRRVFASGRGILESDPGEIS